MIAGRTVLQGMGYKGNIISARTQPSGIPPMTPQRTSATISAPVSGQFSSSPSVAGINHISSHRMAKANLHLFLYRLFIILK